LRSPQYSLDQDDTSTSLEKFQIFINNYPNSKFSNEANILVSELQTKLERKDYEISKQYYTISDYKSALKSLDNFIPSHPGTSYREGALYYKFLSAYEIAINSIRNKQKERLEELVILHDNIMRYYPETIYSEDLKNKINNINNLLNNFKKT
jgi:outer membrane protein assembly factor BamD